MPNPAFGGQFGPENKLTEGQPNEYDVICRNASVLAFHLWPTIFAGKAFQHHYTPEWDTSFGTKILRMHNCKKKFKAEKDSPDIRRKATRLVCGY